MTESEKAEGRCGWCGTTDPLYIAYHDTEWGVPEYDPRALWEKLVLDGFQAGLAWITILRKREGIRDAFDGFDPEIVARYDEDDIQRLLGICAPYLPQQPWFYGADELTDRSEKFLASETVREKLFRFTGDELPYTSTVVIDKFDEEPSPKFGRFMRIAATIVVERDGHKAMVIGAGGERLKMISTEARQELEKLLNAKVFLEVWVKVRSGWADDAARVKSFGYE